MSSYNITADIRIKDEKVAHMRSERRVPGIIYGKKQDPISISLDASDILRLYRAAWKSNIIDVAVWKKNIEVLIHELQFHPVKWDITHVDLYAIVRGEALHAEIPLNFIGEAPAKKDGAIVEEVITELKVKCRPRDLVDHFDVDTSLLKEAGDVIRVSDLNLDEAKYEIESNNPEDVVVSASLPRAAVATDDEEDSTEWDEETSEEAHEKTE